MHAIRAFGECLAVGSLIVAAAALPGAASTVKERDCRNTCGAAIATCIQQGFRKRFCRREVLALCKQGSTMCSVTPTTIPVCVTTTTTLPTPSGACLGPAGCGLAPSGITSTIASADALRARLIGLWYDCKSSMGPESFGSAAAGIEFTSDGSWYFLSSGNGTLVRETGFGQAGTYDIIDTSLANGPGHFQLNLNLNTGTTYILQWTLAAQPQLLRIDNEGVQEALYSHMPGAPACSTSDGP
jgi:hypothetical protein